MIMVIADMMWTDACRYDNDDGDSYDYYYW